MGRENWFKGFTEFRLIPSGFDGQTQLEKLLLERKEDPERSEQLPLREPDAVTLQMFDYLTGKSDSSLFIEPGPSPSNIRPATDDS